MTSQRDADIENAARIIDILRQTGDRWLAVLAIACDAAIRYAGDFSLTKPRTGAPR